MASLLRWLTFSSPSSPPAAPAAPAPEPKPEFSLASLLGGGTMSLIVGSPSGWDRDVLFRAAEQYVAGARASAASPSYLLSVGTDRYRAIDSPVIPSNSESGEVLSAHELVRRIGESDRAGVLLCHAPAAMAARLFDSDALPKLAQRDAITRPAVLVRTTTLSVDEQRWRGVFRYVLVDLCASTIGLGVDEPVARVFHRYAQVWSRYFDAAKMPLAEFYSALAAPESHAPGSFLVVDTVEGKYRLWQCPPPAAASAEPASTTPVLPAPVPFVCQRRVLQLVREAAARDASAVRHTVPKQADTAAAPRKIFRRIATSPVDDRTMDEHRREMIAAIRAKLTERRETWQAACAAAAAAEVAESAAPTPAAEAL